MALIKKKMPVLRMSKLGAKIMITVALIVVVVSVVLVTVSLVLTKVNTDSLMLEQSAVGVNTLKADLETETTRLKNIADFWGADHTPARAVRLRQYSALEESWAAHKGTESDFCALFDETGAMLWSSEGYGLSTFDVTDALDGKTIEGIHADANVPLSLVYSTSLYLNGKMNGAILIGTDLGWSERLDETAAKTGAQVTLFAGKTRYATTIVKADGTRAVGTDMSAAVERTVINEALNYVGQADILGQNHYVHYEPILGADGSVIGAYFAGYSSASADAMIANMIFMSVVIVVVLMILAGVLVILTTTHLITKPIQEALKISESMNRGELSTQDSRFRFAEDEVGHFVMQLEQTKHKLGAYVNDISRILSEMAKGDFTAVTEVVYKGDFIEIENSFRRIGETLAMTILGLNTAAEQVAGGSAQFADSSRNLTDGAVRQASAIDRLSATIGEISNQVERSAENSAQANEYSQMSAEKIGEQSREIESMTEAMREIKAKSDEIGKIIKTIDDIAFQTNILALNAAVEAARAGE
ncbi:MAG: methyl-accepting chemotaxis protein, partial [Eubacterium sp.]|nr:methyl-accepting chemotaxis protein [Eubacterium sp.]